jgi:hypothetical protein
MDERQDHGARRRRSRPRLARVARGLVAALLVVGVAACGASPAGVEEVGDVGTETMQRSTTTRPRPVTTTAPTTTSPPPTTSPPATSPPPTVSPPPPPAPPPPPDPEPEPPTPPGGCHPSYEPCVPMASDVDCAAGTGDGPAYTGTVQVVGPDVYDLDRDGDGVGCEDG